MLPSVACGVPRCRVSHPGLDLWGRHLCHPADQPPLYGSGSYAVMLMVTDNLGATASTAEAVTVNTPIHIGDLIARRIPPRPGGRPRSWSPGPGTGA
jgi:hypothetical protein